MTVPSNPGIGIDNVIIIQRPEPDHSQIDLYTFPDGCMKLGIRSLVKRQP